MARLKMNIQGVALDIESDMTTRFGTHVKRVSTPQGVVKLSWSFDSEAVLNPVVESTVVDGTVTSEDEKEMSRSKRSVSARK